MFNVSSKICEYENCFVVAHYDPLFKKKRHCAKHRNKNEFRRNHPKCSDCSKKAFYIDGRLNYPKRCEEHKLIDDKNIIESPCKSCKLLFFLNEETNMCNDFFVNKVHKAKDKRSPAPMKLLRRYAAGVLCRTKFMQ